MTLDVEAARANMDDFRSCIAPRCAIADEEVLVRRYELSFLPWKEWRDDANPAWWTGYNKVKHDRDEHYRRASLKNALYALGGLFVLVLYVHKAERREESLEPMPRILGREKEPGALLLEQGYEVPNFTTVGEAGA